MTNNIFFSSLNLNKLFIRLTSLMVTCLLHSSCNLSSPKLGIDGPSSSTSGVDAPSNKPRITFTVDTGIAGKKHDKTDRLKLTKTEKDGLLHYFGDDACGVTNNNNGTVIVVCDGVGSLDNSLIWSKTIAQGILSSGKTTPKEKIEEAYNCNKDKLIKYGATTVCVTTIYRCYLQCANLGDSEVVVVRKGMIVFRSKKKIHSFNKPYMLGKDPYELLMDTPDDCNLSEFTLQSGDIIVEGTDGLFDNLYQNKLTNIVSFHKDAQAMAEDLATIALDNSKNKDKRSPYQDNIAKGIIDGDEGAMKRKNHKGGKPDDISVVVAIIK